VANSTPHESVTKDKCGDAKFSHTKTRLSTSLGYIPIIYYMSYQQFTMYILHIYWGAWILGWLAPNDKSPISSPESRRHPGGSPPKLPVTGGIAGRFTGACHRPRQLPLPGWLCPYSNSSRRGTARSRLGGQRRGHLPEASGVVRC